MKGETQMGENQVNQDNPIAAIHRTHYILRRLEDKMFAKYGLTTEQYEVLIAVRNLKSPVRITDVALRIMRSVNSVSMIVDRMVRADLLNRVRDEEDRRTVHVSITDKAENLLKAALPAGQEFICDTLSHLGTDDKNLLVAILAEIA